MARRRPLFETWPAAVFQAIMAWPPGFCSQFNTSSGACSQVLTHNLHGAGGRTASPVAWWVGYAFSPDFVHWKYSPLVSWAPPLLPF